VEVWLAIEDPKNKPEYMPKSAIAAIVPDYIESLRICITLLIQKNKSTTKIIHSTLQITNEMTLEENSNRICLCF
jgi:hypothetical protein